MVLVLAALSLSAVHYKPHEEKSFIAHMRTHHLIYTGAEYHIRLGIYLANARRVREHNAGSPSFTVSLNHLATLTPAEYTCMLGFKHRPRPSINSPNPLPPMKSDPPPSFDYRDLAAVNMIEDQGQCGAGWAFAAISAQETQWFLTAGRLYSLSEQNLIDCVDSDYGCKGGMSSDAYDYVIQSQNGQFALEADYPFTGPAGSCLFSAQKPYTLITGYYNVPYGDEADLLNAVYTKGAVAVYIDSSYWTFQLYSGGIYDSPDCTTDNLDHGMTIVGWGIQDTKTFWIVRNSWRDTWGENGYIRMRRNKKNQCGIASAAIVPTDQ
jgi:cathepsin L